MLNDTQHISKLHKQLRILKCKQYEFQKNQPKACKNACFTKWEGIIRLRRQLTRLDALSHNTIGKGQSRNKTMTQFFPVAEAGQKINSFTGDICIRGKQMHHRTCSFIPEKKSCRHNGNIRITAHDQISSRPRSCLGNSHHSRVDLTNQILIVQPMIYNKIRKYLYLQSKMPNRKQNSGIIFEN